jgi:hypothetical protein
MISLKSTQLSWPQGVNQQTETALCTCVWCMPVPVPVPVPRQNWPYLEPLCLLLLQPDDNNRDGNCWVLAQQLNKLSALWDNTPWHAAAQDTSASAPPQPAVNQHASSTKHCCLQRMCTPARQLSVRISAVVQATY